MITSFYTCKRQVSYIGSTLDSYFDFYIEQPLVFEQPGTEPYLNRTKVQKIPTTATGLIDNWLQMVEWLKNNTYDELYMLCEDDICFRSVINLPKLDIHTGYLSPYCAKVNVNGKDWHRPNIEQYGQCGALCMILTRRSLESVIDQKDRFLSLTGGIHLDTAIGKFFKNCVNLIHYPTLILHMGDISSNERNNDINNPLKSSIDKTREPAL